MVVAAVFLAVIACVLGAAGAFFWDEAASAIHQILAANVIVAAVIAFVGAFVVVAIDQVNRTLKKQRVPSSARDTIPPPVPGS